MSQLSDRSGKIYVAGSAQTIMPPNVSRSLWRIQNVSSAPMWFRDDGNAAAINTSGSYVIEPGGSFQVEAGAASGAGISLISSLAGALFESLEITGSYPAVNFVDRSGTISGTAGQLFGPNPSRIGYRVQNLGGADLWFCETGPAIVNGYGSYVIPPHGSFTSVRGTASVGAVSVIGSGSGINYSAGEW